MLLPKGTRIDVLITYDNSADNPRNPCSPPRRVQWGTGSFDEMGSVNFMMLPLTDEVDVEGQQRMAEAIKSAVQKVATSDAMKRYAAEQKRSWRIRRARARTPAPRAERRRDGKW